MIACGATVICLASRSHSCWKNCGCLPSLTKRKTMALIEKS